MIGAPQNFTFPKTRTLVKRYDHPDFDGELYGENVTLRFLHFLREEQLFSGTDELVARIREDEARAREIIKDLKGERK